MSLVPRWSYLIVYEGQYLINDFGRLDSNTEVKEVFRIRRRRLDRRALIVQRRTKNGWVEEKEEELDNIWIHRVFQASNIEFLNES